MATREELIALLSSRRRGLSIRPVAVGPTPAWQQWLDDDARLPTSRSSAPTDLIAAMALKPLRALPGRHVPEGRWARLRGLFRQGWGTEREEPRKLRYGASASSVIFNVVFAVLLVWLVYLRFLAVQTPEEETVRTRITGFGTIADAGGGEAAADGDVQPQSGSAAPSRGAPSEPSATASTTAASADTQSDAVDSQVEAAAEQPLQVTESSAEPEGFQLPPTREVAIQSREMPAVQTRAVPSESDIPQALPQVRSVDVQTREQAMRVPEIRTPTRELPTAPDPAPQVRIREIAARPLGAEVRVAETSTRALPSAPASVEASSAQTASATGQAGRTPSTTKPGLPGATGQASRPGQQAAAAGVGQAPKAADTGWSSARRNDDWGLGDRNRAGASSGGDRGNPAGQGGSGLFDSEGRPRLADDSFKPRFPDPYKEGNWLKRPSLGYRGTIFDGIWRPPETLLQEWIRKGIKSFDIPLPGGKVRIRCVVSILQAGGGCGPVAGKEGVHDQPARARAAPDVPFKPELFDNQGDLSTPKASQPATDANAADKKPTP